MGMSASQGRLLFITAKLSDLEFQAQQTSNARIKLSMSAENLTKRYTQELDAKKLVFQTGFNKSGAVYSDLSANLLTSYNPNTLEVQRMLKNKNGNILVSQELFNTYKASNGDISSFLTKLGNTPGSTNYDQAQAGFYTNIFNEIGKNGAVTETSQNLTDPDWLYNQLQKGEYFIYKYNNESNGGKGGFDSVSWQTGDTSIQEVKDDHEIERIKTKYDGDMAAIQSQDKKFEMDLKQIDTEHNAMQTEYDTMKKIIDKNIETSFKTFG